MDKFNIDNFIYTKEDAFSKENCEGAIKDGLKHMELDTSYVHIGSLQFPQKKMGRDDYQIFIPKNLDDWFKPVQECIFQGFDEYSHYISSCIGTPSIAPNFKWQMTPTGSGGYSVWHIEQGAGYSSSRFLVWSIYLNDVQDGGETEFLYQKQKIKPKAGTLVIWPAGVTHPHRGNPPYSNDKFILTGWFEFPDNETYRDLLLSTPIKGNVDG